MNRTLALKKLQAYTKNPELIKEPTMQELADLVTVVLGAVGTIEKAIKEGRLDGKTPVPDKDYMSKASATKMMQNVVAELSSEISNELSSKKSGIDASVREALNNIQHGKDGIVTDAEIERAASLALSMMELPDFDAMLSETITSDGASIRNALELLSGDERYAVEITDVVGLQEKLSQLEVIRASNGGTIGKQQVYSFIRQAVADGTISTGSSLPDQTGNNGKFLTTDGTDPSWATLAGGGGSTGERVIVVAASDATDGAGADYTCDGTADEVQINLALADVKAAGGKVVLTDGSFQLAAAISLAGATANNDDNPKVTLVGSGIDATTITGTGNINCIELTDQPKYEIADMTLVVTGTGNAIDQQAGLERGNWQSHVHDIFIKGNFTDHTGWGISMESPFRMRFSNIEMNGVGGGMFLTSHVESFNPGNLSVDRLFVDLWNSASNTNAVGVRLSTTATTSTGVFNLATFNRLDIYGGDTLTSSIGIHLIGATADPGGSYFGEVRQNTFNSLNIEDVQEAIKLEAAPENSFTNIGYTRVLNGGTFISCDDESNNNYFSNMYVASKGSTDTNVIINDANTNTRNPNIFERITGFNASGNTHNGTVTPATVIRHLDLSGGSPTVDTDLDDTDIILHHTDDTAIRMGTYSAGGGEYGFTMPQLKITDGRFDFDANGGKYEFRLNGSDTFNIYSTGVGNSYLSLSAASQGFIRTGIRINDDGQDIDTVIKGDNDANLFYADAGNDRVGIGTATPASKFQVVGTTTVDRLDYDQGVGTVSALGNLGATETIDWATATHFSGNLDSNITFTNSNSVTGQSITLYLTYSGAQRTITWPATTWLDNATGAAPTAPAASGNVLVVTLQNIGGTIYGSATGNYAVYA